MMVKISQLQSKLSSAIDRTQRWAKRENINWPDAGIWMRPSAEEIRKLRNSYKPVSHTCGNCNKQFIVPYHISPFNELNRKYCDRKCFFAKMRKLK